MKHTKTMEAIREEFKEAGKKTGRKQYNEAIEKARLSASVFNTEAVIIASENATLENVINTLLPKSPSKEENRKPEYTYREKESSTFNYSVFDIETGEVKNKTLKFVDYFLCNILTGKVNFPEELTDCIVKYDNCIASLIENENDTITGTKAMKEALLTLAKEAGLTEAVKNGLVINKSIIRANLKTASGIDNKGKVDTYYNKLSKVEKKNEKAKTEKDIKEAREEYNKIISRLVKIFFGIIGKAIALESRDIHNITMVSPEEVKEATKEVA